MEGARSEIERGHDLVSIRRERPLDQRIPAEYSEAHIERQTLELLPPRQRGSTAPGARGRDDREQIFFGASDRIRTRDILITSKALYQLSYRGVRPSWIFGPHVHRRRPPNTVAAPPASSPPTRLANFVVTARRHRPPDRPRTYAQRSRRRSRRPWPRTGAPGRRIAAGSRRHRRPASLPRTPRPRRATDHTRR